MFSERIEAAGGAGGGRDPQRHPAGAAHHETSHAASTVAMGKTGQSDEAHRPESTLSFKKTTRGAGIWDGAAGLSRIREQYRATMRLAAVGDAMGFRNDTWEFCKSGPLIHSAMNDMTGGKGPRALRIDMAWRVSDDTLLHRATAKALAVCAAPPQWRGAEGAPTDAAEKRSTLVFKEMARCYKAAWSDMGGRAPGKTTCKAVVSFVDADGSGWDRASFSDRGGGAGGAMRAACIGLRFPAAAQLDDLVCTAIECARITHHHPTGYLGAVAAAYFTSLALQGVPARVWGARLLAVALPAAEQYIGLSRRERGRNAAALREGFFVTAWRNYLRLRGLSLEVVAAEDAPDARFPEPYGVLERDRFYRELSSRGWGGSSGHDCVLVAYDAFLGAEQAARGVDDAAAAAARGWQELLLRGVLHGGDSDTTGTIAGAWWGAAHGFAGVSAANVATVEGGREGDVLADRLLRRSAGLKAYVRSGTSRRYSPPVL